LPTSSAAAERLRSSESFVDHGSQFFVQRPHMAAVTRLCASHQRGQKHEYTQSDIHTVNSVGGWIDDGVAATTLFRIFAATTG